MGRVLQTRGVPKAEDVVPTSHKKEKKLCVTENILKEKKGRDVWLFGE